MWFMLTLGLFVGAIIGLIGMGVLSLRAYKKGYDDGMSLPNDTVELINIVKSRKEARKKNRAESVDTGFGDPAGGSVTPPLA